MTVLHTLALLTALGLSIFPIQDGFPATPGEHTVAGYSLTHGNQIDEIYGVCKLDEDSASCWNPDGTPDQKLTNSITAAIQNPTQDYSSGFKVTIGQKRRLIIVKSTLSQPKLKQDFEQGYPTAPEQQSPKDLQVWENGTNQQFEANSKWFDGSKTSYRAYEGIFSSFAHEFALRYLFHRNDPSSRLVDLKLGKVDLGSHQIEVLNISSPPNVKPFDSGLNYLPNGKLAKNQIRTLITYRILAESSKYLFTYARLADEDGKERAWAGQDGKPYSEASLFKWEQKTYSQKSGAPQEERPFAQEGAFGLTGYKLGETITTKFYSAPEYCKRLLVSTTRRDIFVFEHIKLDPN